jgi:hypothetical protein
VSKAILSVQEIFLIRQIELLALQYNFITGTDMWTFGEPCPRWVGTTDPER